MDQLQALLARLGPRLKSYIGILVGVAVLAGGAYYVLGRPVYTPIFTGLSTQSAGQISQALTSLKIPYQLAATGTEILVPESQADQARISLANENLPATGGQTTYQNLTSITGAAMTTQQFSAAQVGVLEEDLGSTMATIQGVRSATVQIAEPPQSVWAAPVTSGVRASVYLDLAPNVNLSPAQVRGIVALVASSVPGLKPGNVSVVNQNGDLLNSPPVSPTSAAGLLQYSQALQRYDGNAVVSLLTPIVGAGNVVAQVHVQVTPTVTNTTTVAPTVTKAPVNQSTNTTSSSGNGAVATTTGTTANVPPVYPTTTGGTSTSKQSQTNSSYAVGRIVTTVTGTPLLVTAETVALVVNSHAVPATAGNISAITKTVASALGIPAIAVTVTDLPFQAVPVAKPQQAPQQTLSRTEIEAAGGGLLGGILVAFLLLRRRGNNKGGRPTDAIIERIFPKPTNSATAEEERESLRAADAAAMARPADAAEVIRGWLSESASTATPSEPVV